MLIVLILMLTEAFFIMPSSLAREEPMDLANESQLNPYNNTELTSFVESEVAYAQENGKDRALDEFSNKTEWMTIGGWDLESTYHVLDFSIFA
ncbi:MAG: Histidine kinase [Euryarchaeota archaeon]|nr:Histidine kinase [Euryarchaeota archaeon]